MSDTYVPRWWRRFKDFYTFILPLRFNLLLLLVLGFALIGTDQGHDIIAHLAEAEWIVPGLFFGLATLALALQVWFWSRQLLYLDLTARERREHHFPWWIEWLPRALGFFVFVIVLAAFFVIHAEPGRVPARMINLELLITALAVAFLIFTIVRRKFITAKATETIEAGKVTETRGRIRELSSAARVLYVITLLLDLIFLGVSFSIPITNKIGAPFILVFAFALWVTFGFFLVWLGHRWEMPLLTFLLLFAVAISPWADNHNVRLLDATPLPRKSVGVTFDDWMKRLAADPGGAFDAPVYIVATEGGGIRAAYWTAAVLGRLHDATGGRFTRHLFAISSVSGGSVGAAVYTTAVVNTPNGVFDSATNTLKYDALAPLLASLSSADLLQRFVPFPIVSRDRAAQLEMGWEEGWAETHASTATALREPFTSLYAGGRATWLPSLFLNGTSVENGGRLIVSNCVFSDTDIRNAGDVLNLTGRDLRISTAAHASARFPYVSPVGGLPTRGNLAGHHIADGGYFENSGSGTALQIFNAISQTESFKNYHPKITFIIIDYRPKPSAPKYYRFANELFGPPRGFLATQGAHKTFALGELPNPRIDFTLLPTVPQPLGWMLADASRLDMDAQIKNGPNAEKVAAIKSLLDGK
jgi:hypothetical protein